MKAKSKPHAATKRGAGRKADKILLSKGLTPKAHTTKPSGGGKTSRKLIPNDEASSPARTKRASGKASSRISSPTSGVPPAGTKKPARQVAADTHKSYVSSRRDGHSMRDIQTLGAVAPQSQRTRKARMSMTPNASMPSVECVDLVAVDTQIGGVRALTFPQELLQNYKIYRQIQSALVRLTNQIKAIQKYDPTHGAIEPLLGMRQEGQKDYRIAEKSIVRNVRTLPIWEWASGVRGIAENSLGQILGETGDLSNYANPAKLWKRMGLGLVNGHRQQNWAANRKGYTRTENIQMAEDMGYSARRRALMAVVGSNLIRAKNAEYGALYRERKAFELSKLPVKDFTTGKNIKGRVSHAHKRALRYMEKRFLLNLWKAWRGQISRDTQNNGAAAPSAKPSGRCGKGRTSLIPGRWLPPRRPQRKNENVEDAERPQNQ